MRGFPCGSVGKESTCNAGDLGSILGFSPWVEKIPWRRERLPTPVFWPGEFHGLYSPWGLKELDMTERLSLSLYICKLIMSYDYFSLMRKLRLKEVK